ncbi:MAG: hypothetical protein AVDCRST_MAG53-1842 [uncultured Solirubrobacteraceae bacterium]|uniref:Serine aminopeptidase S33 domain-containing protein n=1 Tax=uncultured Solirubrobacteraceae bacterium TaxID=1162706 RepID=A0A6J4SNJ4_9ACTN|nr:MAG: hypothetical protein AVDCRST_MAG53-1842 [uncultured Solirubrobacteraceae bacterium]
MTVAASRLVLAHADAQRSGSARLQISIGTDDTSFAGRERQRMRTTLPTRSGLDLAARKLRLLMVVAAIGLGALAPIVGPAHAGAAVSSARAGSDRGWPYQGRVKAFDHFVPHVSTVPANAGDKVQLYLRERVRPGFQGRARHKQPRAVLFIPGSATASVPAFDLPFEDYSWMAFLARRGLDAFALDLTGYGRSPRPRMDDACNVGPPAQQALLVPNPLRSTCPASYPFRLGTTQSDLDEIDTAVNYIRELRGVERVSLVGWSLGGHRAGLYAALHPDRVERLVLYAPNYNRTSPSGPPATLPQPGFPTLIRRKTAQVNWPGVSCEGQVDPAVRDPLWQSVLDNDPVGASWGPEDGVMRFPTTTQWGWNATTAAQVTAATLIVRGALDTVISHTTLTQLHDDLGTAEKALVTVPCASHFMIWETRRHVLHELSANWLTEPPDGPGP